ncbi:MAG: ribosome biogenesis GTPase Der [Chlamydiae bacterium]|nr:MAG: ribosome biogenesis GTPase Der [Chlamydiota bacterium]
MYKVAIVGRPNVGKSALFNRIAGRRIAIVDSQSGVTRDRLQIPIEWNGSHFVLIDTGGLVTEPDELEQHIAHQVELALAEADLILFTVDGLEGRTSTDDATAELLRKTGKKVWLVVNKVDEERFKDSWIDFAGYGFEKTLSISALHGRRIGDLLDEIAEGADKYEGSTEEEERPTAIAIVGRPNAGKSSFVNQRVGENRSIVSNIPGTTRDAVDVNIKWEYKTGEHTEKKDVLLIDTAGIKRGKTVKCKLDYYSINRAEKAIRRASVAVLLCDASVGMTVTDKKIANAISVAGTGCVIGVNKWDLMEGKMDKKSYEKWVRQELPFLNYAPIVFLSAMTGNNISRLVHKACDVDLAAKQEVTTGVLNRLLHDAFEESPPPVIKRRRLKFYYGTQTGISPPHFLLFVNDPRRAKTSYSNYLVNRLRDAMGFEGSPIVVNFRARRQPRIREGRRQNKKQ